MNLSAFQVATGLMSLGTLGAGSANAATPPTAFIANGRSQLTPAMGPTASLLRFDGASRGTGASSDMRQASALFAQDQHLPGGAESAGEPRESTPLNWAQTRFAGQIQAQHDDQNFGTDRQYGVASDTTQSLGDCLVIPLNDDTLSSEVVQGLDAQLSGQVTALSQSGDLPSTPGACTQLPLPAGAPWSRLVFVNTPTAVSAEKPAAATDAKASSLAQNIARALKLVAGTNAQRCCVLLSALKDQPQITPLVLQRIVTNTEQALYQFDHYKSNKTDSSALQQVDFALSDASVDKREAATQAITQGLAIAQGMNHARDLANMPANDCTPTFLAQEAEQMAVDDERFATQVLDEAEMKALGMNSLLSVSNGSQQPAKLIMMRYQGATDDQKPIAIVGKGITFDSGGISIKPSTGMEDMKFDMGGAASVFGVMTALKAHRPEINVVGVVAAAENMPSGTATRPGDVVETLSGKTVEIINTDAEGRLVLCDAITHTQNTFDPKQVIDVATLTGAIVVALGDQASGVFSNDDQLAQSLVAAGETSGDRAWQMPVWPEYHAQLDSHTADLKNVGGRSAGSITAASFLSAFADRPWAHLDVAATASKPDGATGRPVPLLYQHLMNQVDDSKQAS